MEYFTSVVKLFYVTFLMFGLSLNISAVIINLFSISAQYSDVKAGLVYVNLLGVVIFLCSIKKEIGKYVNLKNCGDRTCED